MSAVTNRQATRHGDTSNQQFCKDPYFAVACASAKIPTTKRQASKFRNRRGLAYKHRNAVQS